MEFFEAIEQRASVRQLRAADVPEDDLERILDAGRRAPSGMNLQPYELIVIRDGGTLGKLAEAQSCIADVSMAIAVVADPAKSKYWLEDVAATTENMLLAITALGYATVWIEGTLLRAEEQHKQTLGVPDNLRLMVVLPIGAAAEPTTQGPKQIPPYLFKADRLRAVQRTLHDVFLGNEHGLAKRYLNLLLEKIEIDGNEVRLVGDAAALCSLGLSEDKRETVNQTATVPPVVLSWLPLVDSFRTQAVSPSIDVRTSCTLASQILL